MSIPRGASAPALRAGAPASLTPPRAWGPRPGDPAPRALSPGRRAAGTHLAAGEGGIHLVVVSAHRGSTSARVCSGCPSGCSSTRRTAAPAASPPGTRPSRCRSARTPPGCRCIWSPPHPLRPVGEVTQALKLDQEILCRETAAQSGSAHSPTRGRSARCGCRPPPAGSRNRQPAAARPLFRSSPALRLRCDRSSRGASPGLPPPLRLPGREGGLGTSGNRRLRTQ